MSAAVHQRPMSARRTAAAGERLPTIASTCKTALAVFAEYNAQHKLAEIKAENVALKRELACFGTSVGCVYEDCSNCGHTSANCDCLAWTCRCYRCWLMRRVYRAADAATVEGGMLFRMVDDSADNPAHVQQLLRERSASADGSFLANTLGDVLGTMEFDQAVLARALDGLPAAAA